MKLIPSWGITIASLLQIIKTQEAGQCGDIINDPFINLDGINVGTYSDETNTFSNLHFDGYCGMISTPNYGYAVGKIEDNGQINKRNTYSSVCRVQCMDYSTMTDKDGKSTARLIWIRTEKKWMQTKYLQCICKTNLQGQEVCRYKRRGYRPKRQGLRGYDGGTKEKALQVSCNEPTCTNPALIPEFSDPNSSIPELYDPKNPGTPICTNCNFNNNRGSAVWKCYDNNDNQLLENSGVPKTGYCKLTCPSQPILDQEKVIRCQYPHIVDNQVSQYKHVWRAWKFMNSNRYKNLLGTEIGWTCSDDHSDDNIDPNVKVILNAIDSRRSRKPNAGKGPPPKPFVLPINGGEMSYTSNFNGNDGYKSLEFDKTIAQIDFSGSFSLQFTVKNLVKLDDQDCGILHGVEDSEDSNNLAAFQSSSDGKKSMFPFIFIEGRSDSDYYLGIGRSACFRDVDNTPDEPIDNQIKKWELLNFSDNDSEHSFEIILINNVITLKIDGTEHGTKKSLRESNTCQNQFRRGILLKASSQYLTPCGGRVGDITYTALCDNGSHLNTISNDKCETNICTCENGLGAEGETCATHQTGHCQSCENGYYLDNGSCLENICVCPNGNHAIGLDCPNHGDPKCLTDGCFEGYHFVDASDECLANVCYCDNGTPKGDGNCLTDQDHNCQSCNDSYHIDGNLCKQNTCTCNNGISAGPYNWTSDRVFNTQTTDYMIDSEVRAWQNYKLEFQVTFNDFGASTQWRRIIELGGLPDGSLTGHRYPTVFLQKNTVNDLYVGTWNSGYADGDTFSGAQHARGAIPMTWTTGVAYNFRIEQNLADITVYMDDTELISWNTAAYIPDNNEGEKHYLETAYPAEHLQSAVGLADAILENVSYTQTNVDVYCDVDNTAVCQSCREGYHLDENNTCRSNCFCDNGTPSDSPSTNCPTSPTQHCQSCNDSYHLDGNLCKQNTCTCANGIAAGPYTWSSDRSFNTNAAGPYDETTADYIIDSEIRVWQNYKLEFTITFNDFGPTNKWRRLIEIGQLDQNFGAGYHRYPSVWLSVHSEKNLMVGTNDRGYTNVYNHGLHARDNITMTWTTGVAYNLVIEQNLNNVEVYLDDNLLVSWDTAVYIPDTHEGEKFNLETGFPENWHNYDYDNVADAVLENIKYTQIILVTRVEFLKFFNSS